MKTRLFFLLFALLLLAAVAPLRALAAPADLYDGMAIDLSGFTPQQEQVIRNGIALFDDMASPQLQRPAVLHMSAVPGTTCTTTATWRGAQLVDVSITFGVARLGVGQVVHELMHVLQVENPAWNEQERDYASAHPYPDAGLGAWIDAQPPRPAGSEYCPHVVESTFEAGAGLAAYAATQPESVRWCLDHLSNP
jgi:hypothetical protein